VLRKDKWTGLMETLTAKEWLNAKIAGKKPDASEDVAAVKVAVDSALPQQSDVLSNLGSNLSPSKIRDRVLNRLSSRSKDSRTPEMISSNNQSDSDVSPSSKNFIDFIDETLEADKAPSDEHSLGKSWSGFKAAPGFDVESEASKLINRERRRSRLVEKSAVLDSNKSGKVENIAEAEQSVAAMSQPFAVIHDAVASKQVASVSEQADSVKSNTVARGSAAKDSLEKMSRHSLRPGTDVLAKSAAEPASVAFASYGDLQKLSQRLDTKLADVSSAIENLKSETVKNQAALADLHKARAEMLLPQTEPLRVAPVAAIPEVATTVPHMVQQAGELVAKAPQGLPAAVIAASTTQASVKTAPVAKAQHVGTLHSAPDAKPHLATHMMQQSHGNMQQAHGNARLAARSPLSALVWLLIAALAIGLILMMSAPLRMAVQKLGEPATYSLAGARLGDVFGGINTGVALLSDRIRSIVVR
jgi:hypothetical protein